MQGGTSWILIACLASALAVAAIFDWRSRIIPNSLNLLIAILAIPFWWATGLSIWPDVAIQIAMAAGLFALFALAFHFGAMGGGDVKLVSALALWLPPGATLKLLVIMSIAGGFLTLAMVIRHRIAKSGQILEIPYGIAIAFGGFWLISERFLNQFS
jgi:prepilin peptidase CpaA